MQGPAGACSVLFKGVYAVPWGLPPDEVPTPGLSWRWSGEAVRLDGGAPALWLARPLARRDIRPHARSRLRRLPYGPATPPEAERPAPAPPGGIVLTDGRALFPARLVRAGGRMVLVFDPFLPPPDTDLWIAEADPAPGAEPPVAPGGLLAGTPVDTALGPRPAESLVPGEMIRTRDGQLLPLLWCGRTRLSGAELALHPHLRPVLIRPGALGPCGPAAPLRLAPGHRLARPGRGLRPGGEVLVTARDLIDGAGIRADLAARSADYVHLLLDRHALIEVAGTPVETFHPALADPVALRWHARGLERALPGLTRNPWALGDTALPCLDPARAALLRAA
jgi:hypothetical protein